jgi:hypothetical protein
MCRQEAGHAYKLHTRLTLDLQQKGSALRNRCAVVIKGVHGLYRHSNIDSIHSGKGIPPGSDCLLILSSDIRIHPQTEWEQDAPAWKNRLR